VSKRLVAEKYDKNKKERKSQNQKSGKESSKEKWKYRAF
jgi:hypothetical protein